MTCTTVGGGVSLLSAPKLYKQVNFRLSRIVGGYTDTQQGDLISFQNKKVA
jgi:hypothetical protein